MKHYRAVVGQSMAKGSLGRLLLRVVSTQRGQFSMYHTVLCYPMSPGMFDKCLTLDNK